MLDDHFAQKEDTLIGFVYEIEEGGRFKGIAISTGDIDYFVEMNEQGERLCKEIENDVRVSGYITRYQDVKNRILVTGYEVLQEEFEPGNYNDLYDDGIE